MSDQKRRFRDVAGDTLRGFFTSFVPLFLFAHFGHHILTAIASPLLPMIRSTFSLTYAQSGLLLSAFTITYGLGHLPAGWLADRISPIVMISVGTVGVAVGGVAFAVSPTFGLLIAANALLGLAGSGYHPAASYLISRTTRPERRGSALGIHVIGGSGAYFLAPIMAGGIAAALGWRSTYLILSAPTLALGVAMSILLRRAHVRGGASHEEEQTTATSSSGARFWAWLISFLLLTTLGGALVGSTIGFIPLLFVDAYGLREEAAAGLVALIFSAGLWAAPIAGHLSDRVGRVRLLVIASFMVVPIIFFIPRTPMGPLMYLVLLLLGVYVFVRMPVSEAFLYTHAPVQFRSSLLGVYFLGTSTGGGVFTPLIGRWADILGFSRTFGIVAAIVLVVTIASAIMLSLLGERAAGGATSGAR